MKEYFDSIPYFKEHPELCGTYEIKDDPLGRDVCFGMVRGRGDKAVVLIHHCDVVGIEDFKLLKDYAFMPDELGEKLMDVMKRCALLSGADFADAGEWEIPLSYDGIHLSEDGHRRFAEHMGEVLTGLL